MAWLASAGSGTWPDPRCTGKEHSKSRRSPQGAVQGQNGLQAPVRVGKPRGPKNHDGKIVTERVNEMWATDMTSTITLEGQANIFVAVDHCCTGCVGIHASRSSSRFEALEPLR
jgi:putative transposase